MSSILASSVLPKAPPAAPTAPTTASSTSNEPEWARLVKLSLQPRLLRLPILTLAFLHLCIVSTHVLVSLKSSSTSFLSVCFAILKPTLILCSLTTFILGVLPALVVRRRLLSRRKLENFFCGKTSPRKPITLGSDQNAIAPDSLPALVIYQLTQSSSWTSAVFHGILSSLFSVCVAAAFALYSDHQAWWLPYHQVPSTRRTTGSFGRVISSTEVYWRPNEVFWCLVIQPFFTGLVASLFSSVTSTLNRRQAKFTAPIPPPRIPPFPASLVDCLAPDVSVKGSLMARITSTVPVKIILASGLYGSVALTVAVAYLPLRLPLFRIFLALLPPYSALRRLCIPTLRSGYGLTASSNLFTLLTASTTIAAIQGATLAVAINLWEIYATHPMGITSSNLSAKPIETLLSALEIYTPTNTTAAAATSPAERSFLFSHAIFDLTSLSTDITTQGSEKRRAFFKHFAVPTAGASPPQQSLASSLMSPSNHGTVSAWERLSDVLMALVKQAVKELKGEEVKPAQAKQAAPNASAAQKSKPPAGKQVEVKSGGVVGDAPAAPATSTAVQTKPTAATPQPSSNDGRGQTVWQRLVAPQTAADAVGAKQQQATASSSTAPASTQQPSPAPSPTGTQTLLRSLVSTATSTIPGLQSALTRLVTLSNSTRPTSTSPLSTNLHCTSPLSLILITHSVLRLLPLSLHEDEWGSVTLSERRGLGVEGWIALLTSLLACVGGEQSQEQQHVAGDQDEDVILALLLRGEIESGVDRTKREFGM